MAANPRVVILGGGFGGLEATFYLRHRLGSAVDLTLISDRDYFLFKPNTIYIPFGADPDQFKVPLDRPTKRKNIDFIHDSVRVVDLDARRVIAGGREIHYDFLIVATGAAMRPEEIPGFKEHALTLWTPEHMMELRAGLQHVAEKAKGDQRQRVVFVVPPNNRCSGPLYELILMLDTWLRERKLRHAVDLIWTTKEESFIQAFGPRLDTVVTDEFEERGIESHKGFIVTGVTPEAIEYQSGERLRYDLLVGFPPYIAAERFPGLPVDDRGFIHVEPDSRRVTRRGEVFCVGDAADFPIKQAFLALLQADAAAEHLTAEINGVAPELNFEPMSMCVMEELNKATFAQVPLKYTGDEMSPVAVDTADSDHYKVGVSPVWRAGKKLLGMYLPWRVGSGEPFHAGFAWHAMDMGLKVMSTIYAR